MKNFSSIAFTFSTFSALMLGSGCATKQVPFEPKPVAPSFSISELPNMMGDDQVILLSQPLANPARAQIVEVYVLPGHGMNVLKINAYIPGKGMVELISPDPQNGGAAISAPFANRIRGKKSQTGDPLEIQAQIDGKTLYLPGSSDPKESKVEINSEDGLISNRKFTTSTNITPDQASVIGVLESDTLGGHWLSKTTLAVTAGLQKNSFTLTVFAKNAGDEILPMGIGWRPYFNITPGKRSQARLRLPALLRVSIDQRGDGVPTGKLVPIKNSSYDFSGLQGRPLKDGLSLNDGFTRLERDSQDQAIAELVDPAGNYGLRIKAISPEIKAFQIYSPADKDFVAIEPQFNLADPYGAEWKTTRQVPVDTGMIELKPGETTQYVVELELFTPKR